MRNISEKIQKILSLKVSFVIIFTVSVAVSVILYAGICIFRYFYSRMTIYLFAGIFRSKHVTLAAQNMKSLIQGFIAIDLILV